MSKKKNKSKVISFKSRRQNIEVSELLDVYYSKCGQLINDVKDTINSLIAEHDGDNLLFLQGDIHTAITEIIKITGILPSEDPLSKLRKEDQDKFKPKDED